MVMKTMQEQTFPSLSASPSPRSPASDHIRGTWRHLTHSSKSTATVCHPPSAGEQKQLMAESHVISALTWPPPQRHAPGKQGELGLWGGGPGASAVWENPQGSCQLLIQI